MMCYFLELQRRLMNILGHCRVCSNTVPTFSFGMVFVYLRRISFVVVVVVVVVVVAVVVGVVIIVSVVIAAIVVAVVLLLFPAVVIKITGTMVIEAMLEQ